VKSKHRFVFDANVLVSALLFKKSKPRQAFDKAIDNGDVLLSISVLSELNRVLNRRKFDKYLLEQERKAFLADLMREAELIEITDEINACRDPKDDKYLELSVNGKAKYIITGDKDLLVLNPFRSVKILTPQQFLAIKL